MVVVDKIDCDRNGAVSIRCNVGVFDRMLLSKICVEVRPIMEP